MMAQHLLTRPVFEALFEHYDFAGQNPVSRALDSLREDLAEFGLESETRDLEPFYRSVRLRARGLDIDLCVSDLDESVRLRARGLDSVDPVALANTAPSACARGGSTNSTPASVTPPSVRLRARGLDNSEARQRVLMELYEKFFAVALKKDADRLGIVYTPTEVVDFILHSADRVLREEFGRGLSDESVHVLDPLADTRRVGTPIRTTSRPVIARRTGTGWSPTT